MLDRRTPIPANAGDPRDRIRQSARNADTCRITRVEHELLTFALRWLPYGCGPDDEIMVNFGLTRQCYLRRLHELVERLGDHIHRDTATRLVLMCESNRPSERSGDVPSNRQPRR